MADTFTIAAVQMKIAPDRDANLAKAEAAIADGREAEVRRSSACRNSSPATTSARRKTRRCSTSRNRFPGRAKRGSRLPPRRTAWSWSARSSRSGCPASTTTPRRSTTRSGELLGLYRKMHIPDDPLFLEKFYFTPGDLGFKVFDHAGGEGRHAGLLGSVVSRRRRG